MDILQLVKREHARTIDLLDKLADTSSGAVKTRERLTQQLQEQLEFQERALQEYMLPALRAHEETAALAGDARQEDRRLRQALGELDRLPEDDREFTRKLKELKRELQQHFREEEKDLLTPLRRALKDEEGEVLVRQLREAKKEEPEGEEGDGQLETQLASAEAGVIDLRDRLGKLTEQTQAGQQRIGEIMTRQGGQISEAMCSVGRVYMEAARLWGEWLLDTGMANARFAQELLKCRNLGSVAELQQDFVQESTRRFYEGYTRMLPISQQLMSQTLKPADHALGRA